MASRAQTIDRDLSRRSMYGGLVYFGFLIALSVATNYARERPATILLVAVATLIGAAIRLILGLRFEQIHSYSDRVWKSLLWFAALLTALTWGLFLAWTVLSFGYYDWKTLILLICMAGTAPLAIASFTPAPRLLLAYELLFCGPMIVANLYIGGVTEYTMAALFTWYLAFMLMFARRLYAEYRDSLEREAIEIARGEAEAANRAKSELVAHISHELRTPMNAIIGMTFLALQTSDERERRQYLEIVQESGRFLVQLLNRLLDISRIEADKLVLECAAFDLRRLASGVVSAFKADADRQGLRLRLEIAPDVPRFIVGDEGRLRQVLVNILGNAIKFTERGEVTLRLSADDESDASVVIHFSVSDTGIGISPDRRDAIFEPYEQADPVITRRLAGTGLGLAICSRLVKLMRGEISVESEVGVGSTFRWSVRLEQAHPPAGDDAVPSQPALPAIPEKGARILVAEDNSVNQLLLQQLLQRRGHTVHVVSDGSEALDALARDRFDLVLMDLQMPGLDGLQTTAAIRKNEPAYGSSSVRIIALTANAQEGTREECLRAGMNGYLSKPVDPKELYAVVEQTIKAPINGLS